MTTGAYTEPVNVTVNGCARSIPSGTTLASLLEVLALDPRMIVVERNLTILRDRDLFASVILEPGDSLELVHFVGGG